MYVCVCNAVTEKQIHKAIDDGIRTLRELRQLLGVTAECGRCARCARDCLRVGDERPDASHTLRRAETLPSYSLALEAS
jgi:bacterioferritin-associated ferredoxin